MKLGAQFYSIRDKSTTPDDLRASFAEMKRIGYDVAQMSGICKIEAERLRDFSDEFFLPIVCTHSPFDRILNDTDALIKEHLIYRCPVVGLGSMPVEYQGTLSGMRKFLADISEPMKKIKDAGLSFAYHNHAFEFVTEGGVLYNQAPHQLDLFQWIIGMSPSKVRAFCHFGKWHDIELEGENLQHVGIVNNVIKAVQGIEPLYAPAKDGLCGVQLANAMHLSSWLNEEVTLPINDEMFYEELKKRIAVSKPRATVNNDTVESQGN